MPEKTKKKSPQKPQEIVARRLMLVDSKGEPKIYLDAEDEGGSAVICVFGKDGRAIQISAESDGRLSVYLHGTEGRVSAGIGMTPSDSAGLSISDKEGRLGTVLGTMEDSDEHGLRLFREGRPVWSSAKPKAPKRKKPSSKLSTKVS